MEDVFEENETLRLLSRCDDVSILDVECPLPLLRPRVIYTERIMTIISRCKCAFSRNFIFMSESEEARSYEFFMHIRGSSCAGRLVHPFNYTRVRSSCP